MDFEKIIIAVLVFTAVTITGIIMFSDFEYGYTERGIDIDLNIEEYTDLEGSSAKTYNSINESIQTSSSNMFQKSSDTTDTQNRLWSSTFSTLEILWNTPSIIESTMSTIAEKLGVNPVFINVAFIILTLGFVFFVVYILFGIWKG